jgi:hypothetical protein
VTAIVLEFNSPFSNQNQECQPEPKYCEVSRSEDFYLDASAQSPEDYDYHSAIFDDFPSVKSNETHSSLAILPPPSHPSVEFVSPSHTLTSQVIAPGFRTIGSRSK